MIKRIYELCKCADEQGYFIEMEDMKWIDLTVYLKLKRIYEEDIKDGR